MSESQQLDTAVYTVTLRDYFAVAALQGVILESIKAGARMANITNTCYEVADAMLEARKEESS